MREDRTLPPLIFHLTAALVLMALTPKTEICSDLSDSIESGMHTLYNLETATINAIGGSREYELNLFLAIRESNKDIWNQIVQHLERSIECGREVEILGANFFAVPTSDLLGHAEEIAKDSLSLLSQSQELFEKWISYLEEFTKPEKHLRTSLEKSRRTRATRPDFPDVSSYVNTDAARQLIREVRKNMYVDGVEALDAFKKVNEDIKNNIRSLVEFWQEQTGIYTRALEEISDTPNKRKGLTMEAANEISTVWKDALPQLRIACDRILQMCDVVMIKARGAPDSYRQTDHNQFSEALRSMSVHGVTGIAVGAVGSLLPKVDWHSWSVTALEEAKKFIDQRIIKENASRPAHTPHQGEQQAGRCADSSKGSTPSASYSPPSPPPPPPPAFSSEVASELTRHIPGYYPPDDDGWVIAG